MLHCFTKNVISGVCLALGLWMAKVGAQPASGVTAGGKVSAFSMDDIVTRPSIHYPYEDRRKYHQGKGLYRVILDLKTGWARNVTVIKSTGWTSLDNAARSALRELRMRPGKWKQVDFPIAYTMSRSREEAMEKTRQKMRQGLVPASQ